MGDIYFKKNEKKKITIVTATLNAERYIHNLIKTLEDQRADFDWLVMDGMSDDKTVSLANSSRIKCKKINIEKDFGIYDALNKAIPLIETEYYLVVGSDDELNKDTVENYLKLIFDNDYPDLVCGAVIINNKIYKPKSKLGWFYGMHGVSSSHSVGILIKKSLHKKYGLYSNKLAICADQLFIQKLIANNVSIVRSDIVMGKFNNEGVSGKDVLGANVEFLRSQIYSGYSKYIQIPLFVMRLVKNYFKY